MEKGCVNVFQNWTFHYEVGRKTLAIIPELIPQINSLFRKQNYDSFHYNYPSLDRLINNLAFKLIIFYWKNSVITSQ